jgi:hypothetical protein
MIRLRNTSLIHFNNVITIVPKLILIKVLFLLDQNMSTYGILCGDLNARYHPLSPNVQVSQING